ncbi:hypothetical protein [Streptomyces sp. NPDC059168]|uniref:hypothetical protein n=1 Tax=Streptomyces sp. NPDC059168 TaxID=3346753 RepID=UPI0036C15F78
MGLMALVPVAGIPAAMTADVLVVHVLSTTIAARIAPSHGYDAEDPDTPELVQRLIQRPFMAQAAKARPSRVFGTTLSLRQASCSVSVSADCRLGAWCGRR